MLTDLPFDANSVHPESSGFRCRFCLDTGKDRGGFCECSWGQTLLDEAQAVIQRVIDTSDDWSGSSEVEGPDFVLKSEVTCTECDETGRKTCLSANRDDTWTVLCPNCLGELGVKREG